jgi:hypothetical protein
MFMSSFSLDKNAFSVAALADESDERDYWKSKSVEERLEALEFMRQTMYGYDPTTTRLQRVLTVAELARD